MYIETELEYGMRNSTEHCARLTDTSARYNRDRGRATAPEQTAE